MQGRCFCYAAFVGKGKSNNSTDRISPSTAKIVIIFITIPITNVSIEMSLKQILFFYEETIESSTSRPLNIISLLEMPKTELIS